MDLYVVQRKINKACVVYMSSKKRGSQLSPI